MATNFVVGSRFWFAINHTLLVLTVVQIPDFQRMLLNKVGFHFIAHQNRENFVDAGHIFEIHPQQVRFSGSMVVSHSWPGFISAQTFIRWMFNPVCLLPGLPAPVRPTRS